MGSEPTSKLVVAVGGGKGGVGKSVVSSNLGIAMARLGFRVVLVDADLGAANLHTLFGIGRPTKSLQALFDRDIDSLEEAVMPTEIPRVYLVPGSGATIGAANIGHARKQKLIRNIRALDADVVLIDVGAGSGFDVVDLYGVADERLVVVTPQLTSMQNAYAFLKSAVYRSLRGVCKSPVESETLKVALGGGETERIKDTLRALVETDPALAAAVRQSLDAFSASIVGNQVETGAQAKAFKNLSRMFHDFLSLSVPVRQTLPYSGQLHASVTKRQPYMARVKSGPIVKAFLQLAEELVTSDVATVREARRRASQDREAKHASHVADYVRAHPRLPVTRDCYVEVVGTRLPARLADVSRGGLGVSLVTLPIEVEAKRMFRVGGRAVVHVQGIARPIEAIIRHRHGPRLGLQLVRPSEQSREMGPLLAQNEALSQAS